MIFISVQPDNNYYHWQVKVMLFNFIRLSIPPNKIHVLFVGDSESDGLKELKLKFPEVNFFLYKDDRKTKIYVSSIRPNALKKHWKLYSELNKEVIFYHDCDIIFRELPNFEKLSKDNNWYVSDTIDYIGARYINSKGKGLLKAMGEICGLREDYLIEKQKNSGGAQYIIKNISFLFWDKVERDCSELYKYMQESRSHYASLFSLKTKLPKEKYHEIQSFCADMWAVLWNGFLWNKGNVFVEEELKFSWATNKIDVWDKCKIFHNAGVVNKTPYIQIERETDKGVIKEIHHLFCKNLYQNKSPYNQDYSSISRDFCSIKYVEEMNKAFESF